MATKKKSDSRHGKLADDRAQTSITMKKDLLEKCRVEAEQQGRTLSNFLEQLAKNALKAAGKISLLAFAAFHLVNSPMDWRTDALIASLSKAAALIASLS